MNFLLDSNKLVASAMLKSCRKIFLKPDATNFSWIFVEYLLRPPKFQQKYDNECQIVGHEARIQCKLVQSLSMQFGTKQHACNAMIPSINESSQSQPLVVLATKVQTPYPGPFLPATVSWCQKEFPLMTKRVCMSQP